jgi:hypothetical protein
MHAMKCNLTNLFKTFPVANLVKCISWQVLIFLKIRVLQLCSMAEAGIRAYHMLSSHTAMVTRKA